MGNRELVHITIEERKDAITWINKQDVFRLTALFELFNVTHQDKKAACLNQIAIAANHMGYLQRIEKGRYILVAAIPFDMPINAGAKWEDPKM